MKQSTSWFSFGLLVGLVLASLVFAFLGSGDKGTGAAVRQLKIAHALPASHPVHAGMEYTAQRLSEISGGTMQIDIFPNGQLGSETQTIEQLQSGTLDIAKSSAAPFGNFITVLKVFSLPYLFRDEEHFWNVLDGEIGQGLLEEITVNDSGQPSGLRGLTYYDSGSRNFYGKKAVFSPADLKGVKIRVMTDPVGHGHGFGPRGRANSGLVGGTLHGPAAGSGRRGGKQSAQFCRLPPLRGLQELQF